MGINPIRFSAFELWFWPAWRRHVETVVTDCRTQQDLIEAFWRTYPTAERNAAAEQITQAAAAEVGWSLFGASE